MKYFYFFCLFIGFCSCQNAPKTANFDPKNTTWQQITAAARGTTVQMMMWQGDPQINKYMADYVVPQVKKQYDIDLHISAGQGTEIVKLLLGEKEAATANSAMDMCWINGETFFQLRQIDGLYGAFTAQLPNYQYVDTASVFIKYDFQQRVAGMECAWGNVQQTIIYDTVRTPHPPRTMLELEAYIRAHPNKFTLPNEFTGMTVLKSWLIALADDKNALDGKFDEKKYAALSAKLWDFINRNKPYFWRKGATFPETLAATHQLFANGELDFTFSNNDGEADNKILQKVFAPTTKAYVWQSGTVQNSHYLGIAANAPNKAAAMVVINFLISPEAQFEKYKPAVWGDGTVLDVPKLPTAWREKFETLPDRRAAPPRSALTHYALREPAPEYMLRLAADFNKYVLEK
jgi:putative spermidine/putrescine transport system substrate-binding protein